MIKTTFHFLIRYNILQMKRFLTYCLLAILLYSVGGVHSILLSEEVSIESNDNKSEENTEKVEEFVENRSTYKKATKHAFFQERHHTQTTSISSIPSAYTPYVQSAYFDLNKLFEHYCI